MLLKPSDTPEDTVALLSGAWLQRVRNVSAPPPAVALCLLLSPAASLFFQAIVSHTQSVGDQYSKILSAVPMPTLAPVESKGKKKNASRDVAAATPRLEDMIDLNLEFDRAVKGLGAAVDETAWCWTRHTLLPFMKSSIDAAARTAQQGAPVVSHKVLAGHFIEAMHGLQATLNGINALSLDAKAKDALTKHALKCLGGNVLNVLVHGIADPVLVSSLAPAAGAMTADVRTKILMKTNADDSDKVEAANKCPSSSPQTPFVLTFFSFFCPRKSAGLLPRASLLTP